MSDEYQPRTSERLIEILRSEGRNPRAWQSEAAAEIERLRAALKPFAEYYDLLERNGYLEGFDLIARQGGQILGHAGVQLTTLKAAHEAFNQQLGEKS